MTVPELLKDKNLKATPQRIAVFETLYNTDTHPNAETIYKQVIKTYSTMSLATVYKTLDTLKSAGLVQELNVGEESFRYDANTSSHAHMVCGKCNKIFDVKNTGIIEYSCGKVREESRFKIDFAQFYFFGKCKSCLEK